MNCPDCGHANLAGEESCAHCEAPLAAVAVAEPQGMQKLILEGRVRDLGLHEPVALGPDATVAQAVRLMREKKIGCVLVTSGGELAGLFTERDLLTAVRPFSDLSKLALGDVMRPRPDSVGEDAPVGFAFHKMTINAQHHLPVRRASGAWAVVSARDLLKYLCR